MKAVLRINRALRRFFFVPGCNQFLHTVILKFAASGWRLPVFRSHLAARCS
jgi:hypothetical protein